MNKLVAALEWIRNECSPPAHATMDDMPTVNACWQVADTALSEHRAEPMNKLVEALEWIKNYPVPSDHLALKRIASAALAEYRAEQINMGDESLSDVEVGGVSQVVSSGDVRVVATTLSSGDESGASQTSPAHAEPSFKCENGSKFNFTYSDEKFAGQPEPSADVVASMFEKGIATIDAARQKIRANYPKMFEGEEPSEDVIALLLINRKRERCGMKPVTKEYMVRLDPNSWDEYYDDAKAIAAMQSGE